MNGLLDGILVMGGLTLPGLGWALGARWPTPVFAAGMISLMAIFAAVMGFTLTGIAVTFCSIALWLAAVGLGGAFFWWQRRRVAPVLAPGICWRICWLAVPVFPLMLVGTWRAVQQPLPGADVDFRWNYLAELLVQTGNLDFYPPIHALDFSRYFWSDGIAPLVSSLYAWTYLAAGSLDRHWTALPVLLEITGLLVLLRALGAIWGEARGGWLACALGGATFLLQFAFNLGQETGLTALGAGGMVYYLTLWQREARHSLLMPAAACAAVVACGREYGLAFALAGSLWVMASRRGLRPAVIFTMVSLLLPALWYGRNFWRTGNPLYSLNVAGFFPVNPVFSDWMHGYAEIYGASLRQVGAWEEIGRFFCIGAMPAAVGLVAGARVFRRQPSWGGVLLIAGTAVACWLASIPYTAGGLFYSMRVLSPLLVLGCAWGGAWLARTVPEGRWTVLLVAGLALCSLEASARALTVPANPYRIAVRKWTGAGYSMQAEFAEKDLPFLSAAAARVHGKVLSESAGAQRVFRSAGRELVPLWSPEVKFLFSRDEKNDAVDRLLALGYSHILLTRVQSSVDFLSRTGALDRLNGRLQAVMMNDTFVLFALQPPSGRKSGEHP